MATFSIHLMGQSQPISLDLPCADIDELAGEASSSRFIAGHLEVADEDGVCRRVMIATSRIQYAVEA
ncbi:MAG: hypothetical protein AAF559_12150 [Pseudomonadota bacterium]